MDTQIPSFGPYPRFRTKEPKRSWLGRSGPMGGLFARVPRRRRSINPARLWNFGIRLTGGNPWVLRLNAGSCFLPSRMCCFFLVKKWFSLSGISEHPEKNIHCAASHGLAWCHKKSSSIVWHLFLLGSLLMGFYERQGKGFTLGGCLDLLGNNRDSKNGYAHPAMEVPHGFGNPHISPHFPLYNIIYPFYNHFITIILPLYYNTT